MLSVSRYMKDFHRLNRCKQKEANSYYLSKYIQIREVNQTNGGMATVCFFYFLLLFLEICNHTGPGASADKQSKTGKCSDENRKPKRSLNSFLWLVERRGAPPSYFFGTIHVPYTRVWDYIPLNSKEAFYSTEDIYFELDLTKSETFVALSNCQMLPNGIRLKHVLPHSVFKRLKQHLQYVKRMLPKWMTPVQRIRWQNSDSLFDLLTMNWKRKRPIWVMLMVNSLTETDIKSYGIPVLDQYLAQTAVRLNKRRGAVEKVEEQCVPLNSLNHSQVLFALNQTLNLQEKIRKGLTSMTYNTDDLIQQYNCGDLNSILLSQDTAKVPTLTNSSLSNEVVMRAQDIDRYFKQKLIYSRNQLMAARVSELLNKNSDRGFFFAFGAGHFLGNNSVIDILKSRGYKVRHIGPFDELPDLRERDRLAELLRPSEEKKRKRERKRKKWKKRNRKKDQHILSIINIIRPTETRKTIKYNNFNELWIRIKTPLLTTPTATEQVRIYYNSGSCLQPAMSRRMYLYVLVMSLILNIYLL